MELSIGYQDPSGIIYQGDCLDVLKQLQDNSVDCCITSPPYWGLRDYGTATWIGGDPECKHRRMSKKSDKTITGHKNFDNMLGVGDAIQKSICHYCGAVRVDQQLGLEETPEQYVKNLVAVFHEVKRILKPDGTFWLNLGDTYSVSGKHSESHKTQGYNDSPRRGCVNGRKAAGTLKPKDLVGIPWMVAFALREDGWYLRQDIIWSKPNPMPEGVTDRCTKSHEYIFLMSKSQTYYYNHEAIKEKSIDPESLTGKRHRNKTQAHLSDAEHIGYPVDKYCLGKKYLLKNKRSVWVVGTNPNKLYHFATFPEDLIIPMVLTTKKDAIILDPFFGSGTTGKIAKKNDRKFVGIELNKTYIGLAEKRLQHVEYEPDFITEGLV